MKNFLKGLSVGLFSLILVSGVVYAAPNVTQPQQGGTGIGTVTTSDIGKVLAVSSTNPFQYKLVTSTGSGTSTPGAPDFSIQINSSSAFAGSSNFLYNPTSSVVTLLGSEAITKNQTNGSAIADTITLNLTATADGSVLDSASAERHLVTIFDNTGPWDLPGSYFGASQRVVVFTNANTHIGTVAGFAGNVGINRGIVTTTDGISGIISSSNGHIITGAALHAYPTFGNGTKDTMFGALIESPGQGTDRWTIAASGTDPNYFEGFTSFGKKTEPIDIVEIGPAGLQGPTGAESLYVGSTNGSYAIDGELNVSTDGNYAALNQNLFNTTDDHITGQYDGIFGAATNLTNATIDIGNGFYGRYTQVGNGLTVSGNGVAGQIYKSGGTITTASALHALPVSSAGGSIGTANGLLIDPPGIGTRQVGIGVGNVKSYFVSSTSFGSSTIPQSTVDVYGTASVAGTSTLHDVLLAGDNRYINFGTTTLVSGYGFRDNAGTMEFSDSGGPWTPFGTGSGVFTLDGSNNIYSSNAGTPGGNDNFIAGDAAAGGGTLVGTGNILIGPLTGQDLTTGQGNIVLSSSAGRHLTGGQFNFLGGLASGTNLGNGSNNNCIGANSCRSLVNSSFNTFIGENAGYGDGFVTTSASISNATAIGTNAQATVSNTIILGGTGLSQVKVGIGTTTPQAILDVAGTFNVSGTTTISGTTTVTGLFTSNYSNPGDGSSGFQDGPIFMYSPTPQVDSSDVFVGIRHNLYTDSAGAVSFSGALIGEYNDTKIFPGQQSVFTVGTLSQLSFGGLSTTTQANVFEALPDFGSGGNFVDELNLYYAGSNHISGNTVNTLSALRIENQTGATHNWGIADDADHNYALGSWDIGTSTLSGYKLNVEGSTRINGKLTVTGGIDPTYLELAGTATSTYFNMTGGTNAALSAANQARLRYNTSTQSLQISANGGAYANVTSTAGGGDVFLASDQTFTGQNIFSATTTLATTTMSFSSKIGTPTKYFTVNPYTFPAGTGSTTTLPLISFNSSDFLGGSNVGAVEDNFIVLGAHANPSLLFLSPDVFTTNNVGTLSYTTSTQLFALSKGLGITGNLSDSGTSTLNAVVANSLNVTDGSDAMTFRYAFGAGTVSTTVGSIDFKPDVTFGGLTTIGQNIGYLSSTLAISQPVLDSIDGAYNLEILIAGERTNNSSTPVRDVVYDMRAPVNFRGSANEVDFTYGVGYLARTFTASSTQVMGIATNVYIDGPPHAGVSTTITTPLALFVDDGDVRMDGRLFLGGATGGATFVVNGVPTTTIAQFHAAAAQVADLTQWISPGDVVLSRIYADGSAYFPSVTSTNVTSTNLGVTGKLDVSGATVTGLSTADLSDVSNIAFLNANQSFTGLNTFTNTLTALSNDAGALGNQFTFYQNSASPAVNDVVGRMNFNGNNTSSSLVSYGRIDTTIVRPTSTNEYGTMSFWAYDGFYDTQRRFLTYDPFQGTSGALIVGDDNDDGWIKPYAFNLVLKGADDGYGVQRQGSNGLTTDSSGGSLIDTTGNASSDGNANGGDYSINLGTGHGSGRQGIMTINGHLYFGNAAPSVSSCGVSPSVSGNDNAGVISVGSGVVTSCTLTFNTHWVTNAPVCVLSDDSTAVTGDISSVSTSSVVFGFSATLGSGHIYYHCFGY